MYKRKLNIFLGLLVTFFFYSCATIMHGSKQELGISSSPSNAKVTINGQVKGNTPLVADLKRKDNHKIRLELNGYQPFETTLTRKTSGWVWGNIVFGGLIGLAVDAISGGLYKLTPEQIQAELRDEEVSFNKGTEGLFVKVVLTPDSDWEKIGSLKPTK